MSNGNHIASSDTGMVDPSLLSTNGQTMQIDKATLALMMAFASKLQSGGNLSPEIQNMLSASSSQQDDKTEPSLKFPEQPKQSTPDTESLSDDGNGSRRKRGKRVFVPDRPMVIPTGGSSKYVSKVPTLAEYQQLSWREKLAVRMGSWGDRQETMNRAAKFKAAMAAHTNGINLDKPYEDYDYENVMRPNLKRAQVKMEALYGWPSDMYVCTDLAIRLCLDKTRNEVAKNSRKLLKNAQGRKIPTTTLKRKKNESQNAKEIAELGLNLQQSKRQKRAKTQTEIVESDNSQGEEEVEVVPATAAETLQLNSIKTPEPATAHKPHTGAFRIRIKRGPIVQGFMSYSYTQFIDKLAPHMIFTEDCFVWCKIEGQRQAAAVGDDDQYKNMLKKIQLALDNQTDEQNPVTVTVKMNSMADERSDGESSDDEAFPELMTEPTVLVPNTQQYPAQLVTKPTVLVPSTQPYVGIAINHSQSTASSMTIAESVQMTQESQTPETPPDSQVEITDSQMVDMQESQIQDYYGEDDVDIPISKSKRNTNNATVYTPPNKAKQAPKKGKTPGQPRNPVGRPKSKKRLDEEARLAELGNRDIFPLYMSTSHPSVPPNVYEDEDYDIPAADGHNNDIYHLGSRINENYSYFGLNGAQQHYQMTHPPQHNPNVPAMQRIHQWLPHHGIALIKRTYPRLDSGLSHIQKCREDNETE
ncbi:hypothetical protein DFH27DRAFT_528433 [Peziza echinospora]|nr:hypothetical protein DFH27DRAFT_528433 [Peziza echinospora]